MNEYDIGDNETRLHLKINQINDDLDVTITGGVEHIGCVGVVSSNSYNIIRLANHCEDEIVLPIVKKLSKNSDKTIVIKAGIHIDNITKKQIDEILQNNEKILDILMDYI